MSKAVELGRGASRTTGTVVALRPRAQEEFTSSLGMTVFLASWAMMFCALFFAYGFVRMRAGGWPPPGLPRLPLALPALNPLVLLGSSVVFARGLQLLRRGRRRAFAAAVAATFVLGALFLAMQISVWRGLVAQGFTVVSGGVYGSVFYALTM